MVKYQYTNIFIYLEINFRPTTSNCGLRLSCFIHMYMVVWYLIY
jgi:hypothetical protein